MNIKNLELRFIKARKFKKKIITTNHYRCRQILNAKEKDKIPQRKAHAKITRMELMEKLSASNNFKVKCMKFIIITRIELNFQHFIISLFLKEKKHKFQNRERKTERLVDSDFKEQKFENPENKTELVEASFGNYFDFEPEIVERKFQLPVR
jgi:hypothetical protein